MQFTVEGEAAIQEYLKHRPKSVKKISCKPGLSKKFQPLFDRFKMKVFEGQEPLQTPVWAHVELEYLDEQSFFQRIQKNPNPLLVALDHITDPRNLGAIVRTCAFFGVKHVLIPAQRQVGLSNAAVNTAQGGFALVDLVQVTNLSRALIELKEEAHHWIIGADMGGVKIDAKVRDLRPGVLVLGSEDEGISKNILNKCDVVVGVFGAKERVESLNVSVAAGILISELASLSDS